jgi:hypothetical protein
MSTTQNVKLHVVEATFGMRNAELEDICGSLGVDYLGVQTDSEIWIKENLINLGLRRALVLHPEANYFGHIDADVFFRDPTWAFEAVQQLQHFQIIQPWSDCVDLGFQGNILQSFKSFGHQHQRRVPKQKWPEQKYTQYAHTGFSWCYTRAFIEKTSGLLDCAILGSSDHHMAFACISEVMDTVHGGMSEAFKRRCIEWQSKAAPACSKEVGFVVGRIEHEFHGPKKKRYYRERWQILIDNKYDPDKDLTISSNGVIHLINKTELEQDIRLYNRSRAEDSVDE